jgi:hypothetical protein
MCQKEVQVEICASEVRQLRVFTQCDASDPVQIRVAGVKWEHVTRMGEQIRGRAAGRSGYYTEG